MGKIVTLLSGGLDSVTLLHHLVRKRGADNVMALSFNYEQRHNCEINYCTLHVLELNVDHHIVDIIGFREIVQSSSQVNDAVAVPHGHYTDETMKLTVVPNRNMIMLAIAAAAAISNGSNEIAYAAHSGDHAIYPDCRKEFVVTLRDAIASGNWDAGNFNILTPFLDMSKAQIVQLAAELKVDLANTWSCYEGDGDAHCGKCGTCVERREAFVLAGVEDPTIYAS